MHIFHISTRVNSFRKIVTTILATLCISLFLSTVLFNVRTVHAANVWWGSYGYGWFTPKGNNIANAPDRADVVVDVKGNQVTYDIWFNKNRDPHAFSGQVWQFVYLSDGLDDSSIRITREKENCLTEAGLPSICTWETSGKEQTPAQFHTGDHIGTSRTSHTYPDPGFHNDWGNGVGSTDPNIAEPGSKGSLCQLNAWKDRGDFHRSFWNFENGKNIKHHWVIKATVKDGFDPAQLPVVAGYTSSNKAGSFENFFSMYGPQDSDGDGFSDVKELMQGTNIDVPGEIKYDEIKKVIQKGEVIVSKPYYKAGNYTRNGDKYDFAYDNSKKSVTIPPETTVFTLDTSSLPNGVEKAFSPAHMPEGSVYLDPDTGELTFKASQAQIGKSFNFKINVTYPQVAGNCLPTKSEVVTASFDTHSLKDVYNPFYKKTTVKIGQTGKVEPPKDASGVLQIPANTKYQPVGTLPNWMSLNSDGSINLKPGYNVKPGEYNQKIRLIYPDKTFDDIEAPIEVIKSDHKYKDIFDPKYEYLEVIAGNVKTTSNPYNKSPQYDKDNPLPAGTWYELDPSSTGTLEKWVTVQKHGPITYRPFPKAGEFEHFIPIKVHYPDGSIGDTIAKVKVLKRPAGAGDLTLSVSNDEINLMQNQLIPEPVNVDSMHQKNMSPIDLKMVCTKKGSNATTVRDITANSIVDKHQWKQADFTHAFAVLLKQEKIKPYTLYSLLGDKNEDNRLSSDARTTALINGVPLGVGSWDCSVFAYNSDLDIKKVTFNSDGTLKSNSAQYTIPQKENVWTSKLIKVNVFAPLHLPLTGGTGVAVLSGAILVIIAAIVCVVLRLNKSGNR